MSKSNPDRPRVGLALGSGSSRGWSHIGVLKALGQMGIQPDVITGCSIGSIVAAAFAAGNLDRLEAWVRSLGKRDVAGFFDIGWRLNGLVDTERLRQFLHEHVVGEETEIGDLQVAYGSIATDLGNGREIWLTEGRTLNSVMASIALPGLFVPFRHQNRWVVDGGLVNPVPVSLCHALGADIVIAVNLNGDILGKHLPTRKEESKPGGTLDNLIDTIKDYSSSLFPATNGDAERPPNLFDVIVNSINITQDRITRSRMAGDPPDLLLAPHLAHIGLLEFYRAGEAITEGEECVRRMVPAIEYALGAR